MIIFAEPILAERWKSDIATSQFKHWFPQYGFIFDRAAKENCVEEYENYLTKVKDSDKIDWFGGGDRPNALTQPVVLCILDNTTDYIKSSSQSFISRPSNTNASAMFVFFTHFFPSTTFRTK